MQTANKLFLSWFHHMIKCTSVTPKLDLTWVVRPFLNKAQIWPNKYNAKLQEAPQLRVSAVCRMSYVMCCTDFNPLQMIRT